MIKDDLLVDANEDKVGFLKDREQEDGRKEYEKRNEDVDLKSVDEVKENNEKDISDLENESKPRLWLSSKKRSIATEWQDFKIKKIKF